MMNDDERVLALAEYMRRDCGVRVVKRSKDTVYAVYERNSSCKKRRRITVWFADEANAIQAAITYYIRRDYDANRGRS